MFPAINLRSKSSRTTVKQLATFTQKIKTETPRETPWYFKSF